MGFLITIEEGIQVEVGEALIIEEDDTVRISSNRDNTNQTNLIGDTTILHISNSNNKINFILSKTQSLLFRR